MLRFGCILLMLFAMATVAEEMEGHMVTYTLKSWPEHRLRGVNINIDHSPVMREDLQHLAEDWGANHVRVQIFTAGVPSEFGKTPGAVLDYLEQKLDPVLAWCEEFNLDVVLDSHGAPGNPKHWSERPLWEDFQWHDAFTGLWREIAQYYRDNNTIVAYELLNEPNMHRQVEGTPSDWNALARKLTAAIREVDSYHTIMVGPIAWSSSKGFDSLEPTGDPNTIYTFHMYQPHTFTHQGVRNQKVGIAYPGVIDGRMVDKQVLRELMIQATEFQQKYQLPRLYVGEFSAIIWAPEDSAYHYLRDLLELFEEAGWDWAYHAYREWRGWSLEHEASSREDMRHVGDTDRLKLFKGYFARNQR